LLTAILLTLGGSSTVHIYKQTIHRTTQLFWEECGPYPVFASYTLALALQLRKNTEKPLRKGIEVAVSDFLMAVLLEPCWILHFVTS